MYCDFYQMTERPFNVTPDPRCLYLNARYREALAALQYGISQRKGFITLIGEAGTGKTTLLKRLLEEFDEKTRSVFIFNTHVSFEEILEYVFAEFDLPVHNGKKLYMLQRLNTFLLEELRGGGNVALLIDEAQDLDYQVLEDLRLLSNLETAKEKILQIVLSGQPELGEKLANPNLRQLRQRIAVSCRLLPLSRDELSEYVQYRLHAVGCSDLKLFSRDAEEQIYRFSRGIPRLINVVCDNALVIGYALGKKRIGADVISEAAADLMPLQETAEPEVPKESGAPQTTVVVPAPPERPRMRLAFVAVVLVAILIGLLSVGRSMLQRPSVEPRDTAAQPPANVARPAEVIRPGSMVEPKEPVADKETQPVARLSEGGSTDMAPAVARPREVPPPNEIPPGPPVVLPQANPVGGVAHQAPVDIAATADSEVPSGGIGRRVTGNADPEAAMPARRVPNSSAGAPQAAEPPADARAADPPAVVARATKPEVAPPPLWLEPESANREPETDGAAEAAGPVSDTDEKIRLATNQFERVVVQPGDSISRIAMRKYGQSNQTILDLLKLANPDLRDVNVISVGQTLQLPDLSESSVLTGPDKRFVVLVYSTTQATRANTLNGALRARGQHSRVLKGELSAQHPVFRVVIEGFADRAAAAAASRDVQRLFREDSRMALMVR